jgi:hypothetical protein
MLLQGTDGAHRQPCADGFPHPPIVRLRLADEKPFYLLRQILLKKRPILQVTITNIVSIVQ